MKNICCALIFVLFVLPTRGTTNNTFVVQQPDSITSPFSVQRIAPESAGDLLKKHPIDLDKPSNIETEVVFDAAANLYVFRTKIGSEYVEPTFTMTPAQYMAYRTRIYQYNYFREKNRIGSETEAESTTLTPYAARRRTSNRGETDNLFGIGGVKLTTRGSVELIAAIKRDATDNPVLPERSRARNRFDFDQKIQLAVEASVGDKVKFDMNYDTDATFDFDAKRINLAYNGNEDDIVKNIEAGNVSMTTSNSLIDGGAALFGIKTDMQFGKLKVNTILSQQNTSRRTIGTQGATQTTAFEFAADKYDENRHFFLSYHFRNNYDEALRQLPYIRSAVLITRMEVWVTNKKADYTKARNIVAFADLAEHDNIGNNLWSPQGSADNPHNQANTLYGQMTTTYAAIRNAGSAAASLPPSMNIGHDYERLENARMLDASEYSFQPQLGYLSLRTALQPDEVLAVAYEYSIGGEVFQVGEFSDDISPATTGDNNALFVKLLKPVSFSPHSPIWPLMMKNIYSLGYGATGLQSDKFELNITWQSDTAGVYLDYIPEGNINNQLLLRVMRLDRLNSRNDPNPDGIFDFVEGYTVLPESGCVVFPVIEPFGQHLAQAIGDDVLAERYVFRELYDSTLTVARQVAEKNKFRISGQYRASQAAVINLNAMDVAPGSVTVTAGGETLAEGSDYVVDYMSGTVTIINQSIIDSSTPVSVSLEDRDVFATQRRTMMGLNLQYEFNKRLTAGATIMHLYEKPVIVKTRLGEESIKNTLWGANISYRTQSQLLTNLLDRLPFVDATAPSQITLNAEFAQMLPGHYSNKHTGGYSYIDDFETSASGIDLRSPYSWSMASTPFDNNPNALFPEAALTNNIDYGRNRAQLAWFYIDGIFTRRNSSLTPDHIRNDKNQLSDHRVREIYEREIFPNRQTAYGESTILPVLNLSFYPNERGAYNLDTNIDSEGRLLNPEKRWGGIMRRMDTRDFEATNIEYIEFWLMDPFVSDTLGTMQGGDLYFNLGEVSEDVLKDGHKFFENGLPLDGDSTAVGYTVWGKYPKRQSTVYAFDNSQGDQARRIQDVGLNGLSADEEKAYPTYSNYLQQITPKLSANTLAEMTNNPLSPLNAPAGDKFRHYRGADNDRNKLSILDRYKYFNGTEGNSLTPENDSSISSASRATPDTEDIDADNTLNETETYYQYKVSLRRANMQVGTNHIVDKREVAVTLRNGQQSTVAWYQFKVPIRDYQSKVGSIQGFNNIRFMRMFLTGFDRPVFLRFATLQLMRSEWRKYTYDLLPGSAGTAGGALEISTVNIEQNGDRTPVNYVLPPGVTRIVDPSQPQLRQENEQALSIKVDLPETGSAQAIYKSAAYDMRRYKRLQMFVHAEQLPDDNANAPADGELSVFLRLGSDYRDNYYEYEIPLRLTPAGRYGNNSDADRQTVWPAENMFDFPLQLLVKLKQMRNAEKQSDNTITYLTPFSKPDPDKPDNTTTVRGNPSLAEVKVMMVGVRNRASSGRTAEVWINELRLSDFDEEGGWAAQASMNVALSDIGTINLSARKETAGFGALDQSLLERRNSDYSAMDIAINLDLGRFVPPQAKLSAPFYYAYSNRTTTPKYDPFDRDIPLADAIANAVNNHDRDSIRTLATDVSVSKSMSFNNVKIGHSSTSPMPYDPANFTFGYSQSENRERNPQTEYATNKDYRLQAQYTYSPIIKPWQPFGRMQNTDAWTKPIRAFSVNYLPNSIQLHSSITRNYREIQLRDLNAIAAGQSDANKEYLTFAGNFFWNRDMDITWDFSPNLRTSFRAGTVAEIEEPYLQVNKKINRDHYEMWKDSVVQSIRHLGKPLNYEQSANATYTLPFALIPALDWITTNTAYNSRYRWERGAVVQDANIGNYLRNDISLSANSRFNLTALYNKSPFLRETNRRFGSGQSNTDGTHYTENAFLNLAQYLARGLMTVRSMSINTAYRNSTDIPGFSPMIGDVMGQKQSPTGLVPGLPFAFGFDGGEQYISKALQRGWLITDGNNIQPAIGNITITIRSNAILEPVKGLRIELNALYEDNRRTEYQYMHAGMPKIYGGSFAISTIMLASAFERSNAANGYKSAAFDSFIQNRDRVAERLADKYSSTNYPDEGFLAGSPIAGLPFDSSQGAVNPNSSDVLIPAFIAAYTGRRANNIALTAFPAIAAMLPNWDVSYNAITMFPALRTHFRSVILNHRYVAQYRVSSFSSYLVWVSAGDGLGFVSDVITGRPNPSAAYNIASVSLAESFNPLLEVQSIFTNNVSLNARINRTRTVSLNVSAYQIVELSDNDYVVGVGYRVADFNRLAGIRGNTSGRNSRRAAQIAAAELQSSGQSSAGNSFSNELNVRLDLSYKQTNAIIRRLENQFSQATDGLRTISVRFSADYDLSRALTLRAFFDKVINRPLVSSSAYPTANTGVGLSVQFNLNR